MFPSIIHTHTMCIYIYIYRERERCFTYIVNIVMFLPAAAREQAQAARRRREPDAGSLLLLFYCLKQFVWSVILCYALLVLSRTSEVTFSRLGRHSPSLSPRGTLGRTLIQYEGSRGMGKESRNGSRDELRGTMCRTLLV